MLIPRLWRHGAGLTAALCLAAGFARGDDFVSIDFPIKKARITARGLSGKPRQVMTPEGVGYTQFLLRRARKGERIFVTFIFEEDGERGPAVFWSGDVSDKQITLVEDLAEGVRGLNRRTIALPDEVLEESGRLFVMGRQKQLLRVRIDWCAPTPTFVAVDRERPAFLMGGDVMLSRELEGDAMLAPPDVWFGPVLDAALQDGVADLSEAVEFVVPMKGDSGEARLRARFLGLPLGRPVKVWINGKLAGRIVPEIPSLTDPGFLRKDGKAIFAGWREGSLFLEPGALKDGENSIVLEAPGKEVYLRDTALEIFSAEAAEEPEPATKPELPQPEPVDITATPVAD